MREKQHSYHQGPQHMIKAVPAAYVTGTTDRFTCQCTVLGATIQHSNQSTKPPRFEKGQGADHQHSVREGWCLSQTLLPHRAPATQQILVLQTFFKLLLLHIYFKQFPNYLTTTATMLRHGVHLPVTIVRCTDESTNAAPIQLPTRAALGKGGGIITGALLQAWYHTPTNVA